MAVVGTIGIAYVLKKRAASGAGGTGAATSAGGASNLTDYQAEINALTTQLGTATTNLTTMATSNSALIQTLTDKIKSEQDALTAFETSTQTALSQQAEQLAHNASVNNAGVDLTDFKSALQLQIAETGAGTYTPGQAAIRARLQAILDRLTGATVPTPVPAGV